MSISLNTSMLLQLFRAILVTGALAAIPVVFGAPPLLWLKVMAAVVLTALVALLINLLSLSSVVGVTMARDALKARGYLTPKLTYEPRVSRDRY